MKAEPSTSAYCYEWYYPCAINSRYLPPANVVCEGYIFTGVCDSVNRGGCAWFYLGGMRGFIWGGMHGFIRGACVVLFGGVCVVLFGGSVRGFIRGGMHGFIWGGHVWFFQFFRIQWDTVNERAVRILLECILVIDNFLIKPWNYCLHIWYSSF